MFRSRKATAPKTEETFRPLSYADVQPIPPEGKGEVDIPTPEQDQTRDMTATAPSAETPDPAKQNAPAKGADVMTQMALATKYAVEANELPDKTAKEPAAERKYEDPSRLYIGGEIRMKADVETCGVIQVDGHLEASAKCRELAISETGTMIGTIAVDNAEITGKFEGTLTVSGKLLVRSSARISGTVKYGSIEVESGGHISGHIAEISVEETVESAPATEPPTGQVEPSPQRMDPPPSRPIGPLKLNLAKPKTDDGEADAMQKAPQPQVEPQTAEQRPQPEMPI